jgi:uncharacterized surface protein with fasciclin (FAS1) repeats
VLILLIRFFPVSNNIFQKSIAATLGVSIVSAGLFASISSNANIIAQAPAPTVTPVPASGTMTKPADGTTKPADGMSKPADGMSKPADSMGKPAKPVAAGKTIVDLAVGSKSFSTLVAALKAADLVDTLAGEGPFTVFAPTNEAFAKLPKATLAKLLKPENKEQLKKILTYHVVSGAVTSKMLKSGAVDSVEGSKITVKVRTKDVIVNHKKVTKVSVKINNANVIKADVKASNGYIHAIDTVIMPPAN